MTAVHGEFVPVNYCRQVKCVKCGKTTWMGCGQHVEAVMKDVKEDDKCKCAREGASSTEEKK